MGVAIPGIKKIYCYAQIEQGMIKIFLSNPLGGALHLYSNLK
jgi:hypothetical protein